MTWQTCQVPNPQPHRRTGHVALACEDGVLYLGGLGEAPPTHDPDHDQGAPIGNSPFPRDAALFLDLTSAPQELGRSLPGQAGSRTHVAAGNSA
mmetsp:Transcript_20413/g.46128  ORF Transcript_20413/g.46128 Transcript_20413/m.46128 type:complete len:94 (+) Transcript_20413:260-541(+)